MEATWSVHGHRRLVHCEEWEHQAIQGYVTFVPLGVGPPRSPVDALGPSLPTQVPRRIGCLREQRMLKGVLTILFPTR